jgi:hypothetical protein
VKLAPDWRPIDQVRLLGYFEHHPQKTINVRAVLRA